MTRATAERAAGLAFLGLDLGTSAVKAVGIDAGGAVLAQVTRSYPTARPQPGRAEQQPADWIRAARSAVRALAARVGTTIWAGAGLSGMIPTAVEVDAAGRPIGPAITWQDARAQRQADMRIRPFGAAVYQRTGQRVDGRYLLPMHAWLAEAGGAARAGWLLGAKDYLCWWLTGERVTDPSTATGYGCYRLDTRDWDPELATAFGVGGCAGTEAASDAGSPRLPEVVAASTLLPIAASAARSFGLPAGTPVCVGAADSVLAAYALGVREPGQTAYIAGTSTVVLRVAAGAARDPSQRWLVTPLAEPGCWGLEVDQLTTGAAFEWLGGLLGLGGAGAHRVLELAATAPNGANGVRVLPHFGDGEQGLAWDPESRGRISGLTLWHEPRDLARALVEGIVAESAEAVAALRPAGAGDGGPRELHAAGHVADLGWFRELLAAATAQHVVAPLPAGLSASGYGAALLARAAVVEGQTAPRPSGRTGTAPRTVGNGGGRHVARVG